MEEFGFLDTMQEFLNNLDQQREQTASGGNPPRVIMPTTQGTASTLDKFYATLADLGYNLDELKSVLDCPKTKLILSAAGSGKTTALILKIIRDLLSGDLMTIKTVNSYDGLTQVMVPSKILVSTFLRTGAEELEREFFKWCKRLGIRGIDPSNLKFRTLHAEVRDAIKSMGVHVDVLTDSFSLVRSVANKYGVRAVSAMSRNITNEEVNDLHSLFSFARNRLDEKRYEHPLMKEYNIDTVLLDAMLTDYQNLRNATGQMDFEDMNEMLLEGAKVNPMVREFLANRYDHIYIDEFQDTSQLQYEVLKYYLSGVKTVTVIGDDDQSIYAWRGSDPNIILHRFPEDFKPEVYTLTTNYRCGTNILNFVKPSIELNNNRHLKDLKAHNEGGTISIFNGMDVNALLEGVLKDITSGLRVGVLARVNDDLLIPAIILELNGGVEYSLSKQVTLGSRRARQVFGIMDMITKRYTPEFEGFFKMFLPRYLWYEANNLIGVLVANKTMNLYNIPLKDLQHSVPNLYPIIKGLRSAKEIGEIEAYLFLLDRMEKIAFSGDGLYAKKSRDLIRFTRKIILEHRNVKDLSFGQIDNLFNNVLPEKLRNRIQYGKDTFIKLTTVHEAKGKEWDSVYIWNNVVGSFPVTTGQRSLTQDEFEEERRVHYIAVTRAKTQLTIFTEHGNEGTFLKECDFSFVDQSSESAEDYSSPKKVFKQSRPEDLGNTKPERDYDSYLRDYIAHVRDTCKVTDEKTLTMDLVLGNYREEEILDRIRANYPLDILGDFYEEVFEAEFNKLADELFQRGVVG